MTPLRFSLQRVVSRSTYLNYGRDILSNWCVQYAQKPSRQTIRLLDIGCGEGDDLMKIEQAIHVVRPDLTIELYGVEYYEPYINIAESRRIITLPIDIERAAIPLDGGSVDIVIANQILEHTKDIFWICSEISRVLTPGGQLLVGVPNLAGWHNRLMLLLGMQPASIDVISAHVRGFTLEGFRRFIETDGYFKVHDTRGSNFYPFPPALARVLSRWLPRLAVGLFVQVVRQPKPGTFIHVLDTRNFETNYFRDGKAA